MHSADAVGIPILQGGEDVKACNKRGAARKTKKKPPRKAVWVVEVLVLSLGLNPATDVPR